MAKKPKASAKKSVSKAGKSPVRRSPVPKGKARKQTTSAVRNTSIPKGKGKSPAAAARTAPSDEQIAVRAYEIYASGQGGSEHDNWLRAERELRGV